MIKLGSEVPKRGSSFTAALGGLVLKLMGWKIEGEVPNRAQMVIAVAPHSSNLDFVVAMGVVFSLRLHVSYLGKHTLFKFPLGRLMYALGGIPVERGSAQGLVGKMIEEFEAKPKLVLGIAPEGTRGKVKKWKKGFALIAQATNVPVLPALLDYKTKTVRFEPLITDVSDVSKTIAAMQAYTATATPKNRSDEN